MAKSSVVTVSPVTTVSAGLLGSISTEIITFAQWVKLRTFGSQRDHETRSKIPFHINKFIGMLATHLCVSAVSLPNGDMFKLDGHTRTLIWIALGIQPENVLCTIYAAKNMNEAKLLYLSIDAKRSEKNSSDEIFSAMREGNFEPLSPLIKSCKFNEALTIAAKAACRSYPKMRQVTDMLPTLRLFDGVMPTSKIFPTPIAAAALLSIMRDKEDAAEFWKEYAKGEWKDGSALSVLNAFINDENTAWGNRQANLDVAGKCLAVYLKWKENPHGEFESDYPYQLRGSTVISLIKASLSK